MSAPHTKFYLDKQNKKWKGVCSGIADYTGVDVTIIRIGLVILTFCGGFPWTLIAYWLTAWMAPVKPKAMADETPEQTKFWQGASARSTAAWRRSRPTSPARTAGSPAKSSSCASRAMQQGERP
jgi:phage shock protein C